LFPLLPVGKELGDRVGVGALLVLVELLLRPLLPIL
jgi:hypothetical protein